MTGWLGYALAPAPIINAMAKLQSQSTSTGAHGAGNALAAVSGPRIAWKKKRITFCATLRLATEPDSGRRA
jgi:aspartate/methionine/tyrosine aminotransferase